MTKNDVFGIVFGFTGLVAIGYAIGTHTKMAKISERLDRSINDLADNMEIDIPEKLIDKAVDEAAKNEARRAVEEATKEVINQVKKDIHAKVQREIDKEYDSIKDSVLKEITVSASKIDTSKVRKDVEEAAKKAVLDKFDDNLDDILEKFNKDLDNTSKIYSSIRDAITKESTSGKQFVVTL